MRLVLFAIIILFMVSCGYQHLAIVKQNGRYGAINKKGEFVIEPVWDYILIDKIGEPILVERDGLFGYVDRKGRILIEPKFSDAYLFCEGLANVANGDGQYGFINLSGDTVIDFQYDEYLSGFSNGLVNVYSNNRCGYIDRYGVNIIPLQFEVCYPFMSGIAVVVDSTYTYRLIDKSGNIFDYTDENIGVNKIYPPKDPDPGLFKYCHSFGMINEYSDTIIPPEYSTIGNMYEGMYTVKDKNGKWGAYNSKGKMVIQPIFDYIQSFHEGVANFCLNGKWGYVNKEGKVTIEPIFDYAGTFNYGLAYVELNGYSGFIDKRGGVVIQLVYEPNRLAVFE